MKQENRRDVSRPWISTPLIESKALSEAAGCRILLKLENLQPAGSFKSRGIGNLIRETLVNHAAPHKTHFYSSSGGNAGLACVTAARSLNRPATVVVPLTTKPMMIARIKTAGATDVIQLGDSWKEADQYLREEILLKDPNGVYVPPFDHEDVWKGNSTMIDELEAKPDVIVCSVGGGGLFVGIQQGLERRGWSDVTVLALETNGAHSLDAALREGALVTLPRITSFATSLGATRVAEQAFLLAQKSNVKNAVLSDAEAAMGCWRLADDERLLVEPACGASIAVCYDGRLMRMVRHLKPDSNVVLVVCGGSNITLETLCEYRREYGGVESNVIGDPVPSSISAPNGAPNGDEDKRSDHWAKVTNVMEYLSLSLEK